jgi:hypothetical protein
MSLIASVNAGRVKVPVTNMLRRKRLRSADADAI